MRFNEIEKDPEDTRREQVHSYQQVLSGSGFEDFDTLVPCSFVEGEALRLSGGRSRVFGQSESEHAVSLCCNLIHWWWLLHGGDPTSTAHRAVNQEL